MKASLENKDEKFAHICSCVLVIVFVLALLLTFHIGIVSDNVSTVFPVLLKL